MTITSEIIAPGHLMVLNIALDTESGTLNLKTASSKIPVKGSIMRVFAKYTTDSGGEVLHLAQDGGNILEMGGPAGTFEVYNNLFEKPGIAYANGDELTLVYDVTEAVSVKLYIDMAPQR